MSTSTVELTSDKRRMMVVHIAWRELQTLTEKINPGLGWPMLNAEDRDQAEDEASRCSRMIGQWGSLLDIARDPSAESVELPITRDELRERVGEYIKAIWENDLHEAELEDMQDLLDHTSEAKAFLDSLGGPIAREQVPA